MSKKLTTVSGALKELYPDLLDLSQQEKYANTKLYKIFEQRYYFQPNRPQLFINESLDGFIIIVSGNEIEVSKTLYDNENISLMNSLDVNSFFSDAVNNYHSDVFSNIAYLICPNKILISIDGEIDEPIYVHYKSDFECFYNSVVTFDILDGIEVDLVEEIESNSALNMVSNFKVGQGASLSLFSFYKNALSGTSLINRNVDLGNSSTFTSIVLGLGSSMVLEENNIKLSLNSQVELLGVINSRNLNFDTILNIVQPNEESYISVVYKNILNDKSNVNLFSENINDELVILNFKEGNDLYNQYSGNLKDFTFDISERAILNRISGYMRFYDNKNIFFNLL